jgi:hypothetical protein
MEIARCGDRQTDPVQMCFAIAEHRQICALGRRKSAQQIKDSTLAAMIEASNQFLRDELIVVHSRGGRCNSGQRSHGWPRFLSGGAAFAARL